MAMALLVVDDSESKRDLIQTELTKLGVPQGSIYFAENAASARKALGERRFDLMLLDLNLPTRAGSIDAPSAEVGLELLRQIVEDHDLPAPESIVGITADADSMREYADEFRRLTAQILFVEPGLAEWKQSLSILIGRMRNTNADAYDVDVCILTALREPELSEVLKFPYSWSAEESLGNGVLVRRGKILVNNVERSIVAAHATQMGLVSATFVSRLLIEYFKPRILIMTGVCGGVGDKPRLGDIIVAERSWDWQSGKWLEDGSFESAPDSKEGSADLIGLALGASERIETYHFAFRGQRPSYVPKILRGPLVSGSAVVASSALHERFIGQHRKSIGVDMECYGVYYAADLSPGKRPKVLCIKGVSDLANRMKGDELQEYCSFMSGKVAFDIVTRYFGGEVTG
jgi:nucleoside phosphorylase/CheY-like chemotaxis protein